MSTRKYLLKLAIEALACFAFVAIVLLAVFAGFARGY